MPKAHHWYSAGVVSVIIAVVFIATSAVVLNFSSIKSALTPKPENFTELYFEDHLNLPKTMIQGTGYPVSFTVHNVEHQAMTYPITVAASDENASQSADVLFTAEIQLAPDESKTIPVTITLPISAPRRDKIIFTLENLNQTIDFWVKSSPPVASPSAYKK